MKTVIEAEVVRIISLMSKESDSIKLRELALTVESLVQSCCRLKGY